MSMIVYLFHGDVRRADRQDAEEVTTIGEVFDRSQNHLTTIRLHNVPGLPPNHREDVAVVEVFNVKTTVFEVSIRHF
jgi:hypothetical protein